jgi:hypothetical protein
MRTLDDLVRSGKVRRDGLQRPDFRERRAKLPVSGRMPKCSRFQETAAGDSVRSHYVAAIVAFD